MKTNNNYYFLLVATFALMAVFAPNSTFAQCSELSNAGGVSGYETQCGPYNPTPILSSSLPSGGSGGTIEYAWMKNSSPVNQGATIISNTNSVSYDPPTIDKTTFYRRCARRCGTTVWGLAKESNWVEKRVKFCAPAPNCSGSNTWTWSQSIDPTNGSPSVVGLIYSGQTAHAITTGIPSAVNGPVTISVTDAVSYDGYPNRTNTANQTNERWRLKFYKGTSVVYTTPYTTDGIATGLEQDYWRGPLGGSVFLPNGFDKVFIQHIGGPGSGSVIPASFCVSYNTCSALTNAGTISGNQTYCNSGNMSVSSSSVASGGSGGSIQYQWQWSPDGVTWTSSAATGASWNVGTRTVSHYFRRLAKRSTCGSWIPSNVVLHTVNKELTSAGTISGDKTYCNSGNAPAFVSNSAGSGGSGGSVKYVWQYSTNNGTTWVNMSTQTGATYDPGTLTATRWYRRQARRTTNCGNWLYSNIVKVTIDKPLTSAGTITGDQAYCNAANPPAFGSASAGSGGSGGSIQYQWRLSTNNGASWSNIGGATSSTYNHVAVSSTTWFQRQARRTTACGSWLLSNIVKVTINGQLTSAGTIGSSQTFCNSGDPATLTNTSTPSGGSGGSIQYQWYYYVQGVGPWTAISGATSSTYNPSTITVSTQYRRGAKRSVCGSTIYTPYVTITINKELTSAGTITGNETICNSANFGNITSSSVASGGSGGSVQYQWQYKTTGSWTSISGATGATYDPGVGNVTYQYRRLAKRSTCGSWIYSNVITKTVNKQLTSAGAIGSPQTYCNSYNIPNLTSMTAPSGGSGGTILYVWQKSTNNSTWSTISGATGSTYDPGVISTTTYYRRGAKRSVCGNNIYSSSVKITINKELTSAGTITGNETFCNSANFGNITSSSVASGGSGGSVQYQWQYKTTGSWTNISGATGATYDPGVGNVTYQYRRLAKRSTCGSWIYSNVITKTVNKPLTSAGAIGSPQTYCNSYNIPNLTSMTAPSGGSGGTILYVWQKSTNNSTWSTISGATGATYDPGVISTTTYYRRGAKRSVCGNNIYSSSVKITINKELTNAGTITGNQTYCNSGNMSVSSTSVASGGSGGSIQYQWQWSLDGIIWTNDLSATGASWSVGTRTVTHYFRRLAKRSTCGSWKYSNVVVHTVNKELTNAGTISGDQTYCNSGNAPAFVSNSAGSGGSGGSVKYVWQYSTNNGTTWVNMSTQTGATYDPGTLTATRWYRRQARRTTNCGNWLYSNIVKVTIDKPLTSAGTITGDQAYCNAANPPAFGSASAGSGGSGGSIQYQWRLSTNNGASWSNIGGATSSTYNHVAVSSTTWFQRQARRTTACGSWLLSNIVKVTINGQLTSAGTIGSSQTFCNSGDPATLTNTSTPSGGSGGSIQYQWYYYVQGVGPWTAISGATSSTYNPSTITVSTQYRRGAKRSVCGSTIYTPYVTITINKELTSAGTITGNETICNSANFGNITSSSVASGGSGGSVQYQWQYKTTGSWTNISGATGATYDPGVGNVTYQYRRLAKRSSCGSWIYSNVITKTVNKELTSAGTISGDQTYCNSGNAPAFVSNSAGSGGSGGIVKYVWQYSTNNGATWVNMHTQTGATYDPGTLTSTRWYRRQARRTTNCGNWLYSNIVKITINNGVDAGVDGNTAVCDHSTGTINLASLITGEDAGGTWTRLTGTGGAFNASAGTYVPAVGATTSTFRYTVTGTAPCPNDMSVATVTINVCQIMISGNVFNDLDGLTDNDVDGTGIGNPSSTPIYANLVDASGNIVATTPIGSNGSYQFPNVTTNTTYTIELSQNQGTVGQPAPAIDLPGDWMNTGESPNNSTSDGTPNGVQTVSVGTSNIPNIDFGIQQPPTPGTQIEASQINPGGNVSVGVPSGSFSGTDPSGGTVTALRIVSFPTNTESITINGTTYTQANWPAGGVTIPTNASGEPTWPITLDPIDGAVTATILYKTIDNAGVESPATGYVKLPFGVIGISGNVYEDNNGETNVDGTGIANPSSTQLYANLVDPSGNVVNTVAVGPTGAYNFSEVTPNTTYTMVLSTTQGTIGQAAPTADLPFGWENVSEDCCDNTGNDGNTNGITTVVVGTANVPEVNFGITQPLSMGNRVFNDLNQDGNRDAGESWIPGATVKLYEDANNDGTPDGAAIRTATTSSTGFYRFDDLKPGNYIVGVTPPTPTTGPAFESTEGPAQSSNPNDDVNHDDNGIITVGGETRSGTIVLAAGTEPTNDDTYNGIPDANSNMSIDFGFYQPIKIAGNVYHDENGETNVDGTPINNPSSTPVYANLVDAAGNVVATDPVNPNGTYEFDDVKPNTTYTVVLSTTQGTVNSPAPSATLPTGWENVSEDCCDNTGNDGNTNGVVTVTVGTTSTDNANFGIHEPMAIGNHVWIDKNQDGTLQSTEPKLPGATVKLYEDANSDGIADGAAIDTKITNSNGSYIFTGLDAGNYVIGVTPPTPASGPAYISTDGPGQEMNPNNDDNNNDNGINTIAGETFSGTITMAAGTEPTNDNGYSGVPDANSNLSVDFGFVQPIKLSGIVFNDESGPANVDGSPIGQAGGTQLYANLIKPDGTVEAVTPISSLGMYEFTDVSPNTAYKVVLTDGPATVGNQEPSPSLPNGWLTVSEDCCDGIGNDGTPDGINFAATSTEDLPMVNFGIREPVALGNLVWVDSNKNGVRDAGELPMDGAVVNLYEDNNNDNAPDGPSIATMTTGTDGLYKFIDLNAGKYIVGVTAPAVTGGAYESSVAGQEDNPNLDVDDNDNGITKVGGEVRSKTVNLSSNTEPLGETPNNTPGVPDSNSNLTVDFGFYVCPNDFAFPELSVCLNTTTDLTSAEPSEFLGGVWTDSATSLIVAAPTAVGAGTYTYTYTNGDCSASGNVRVFDNVPDYTPTIQVVPNSIIHSQGDSIVNVLISVSELENFEACSDLYIIVPKLLPRYIFNWEPNRTTLQGFSEPLNNLDWQFFGSANPNFYIWKYTGTGGFFPALGGSYIGYSGIYDPNNTDGMSTFSVQIFQGSGGETNQNNNTESDDLIYFR